MHYYRYYGTDKPRQAIQYSGSLPGIFVVVAVSHNNKKRTH